MKAFWPLAALNLAIGAIVSSLAYLAISSSLPGDCEIRSVDCQSLGWAAQLGYSAVALAMFALLVLLAIRIRRSNGRAATLLLTMPPVLVAAGVCVNLLLQP